MVTSSMLYKLNRIDYVTYSTYFIPYKKTFVNNKLHAKELPLPFLGEGPVTRVPAFRREIRPRIES
jgi:hypothetical protein